MTNISILSLKLVKESTGRYDVKKKISSPEAAYEIFEKVFELSERAEEYLCMITLDTKNKVTGAFVVSQGSVNSSIVHPREIFKRAVMQNASGIIIGHNHPSGDSTPSQEDIKITKRIHEAGEILGIELLDHIIVGDRYISLKEKGII